MTSAPTLTTQEQIHQGLLDRLIVLKTAITNLETEQAALLAQLNEAYDMGLVSDKISRAGWSFSWSPGRKSYDYPEDVVAIEASLQAAKQAAVATKRATLRPSTPYWSIRGPRPAKEAVQAA
jgi:hypothetical protein